jgi:hypothetical protein
VQRRFLLRRERRDPVEPVHDQEGGGAREFESVRGGLRVPF